MVYGVVDASLLQIVPAHQKLVLVHSKLITSSYLSLLVRIELRLNRRQSFIPRWLRPKTTNLLAVVGAVGRLVNQLKLLVARGGEEGVIRIIGFFAGAWHPSAMIEQVEFVYGRAELHRSFQVALRALNRVEIALEVAHFLHLLQVKVVDIRLNGVLLQWVA